MTLVQKRRVQASALGVNFFFGLFVAAVQGPVIRRFTTAPVKEFLRRRELEAGRRVVDPSAACLLLDVRHPPNRVLFQQSDRMHPPVGSVIGCTDTCADTCATDGAGADDADDAGAAACTAACERRCFEGIQAT